MSDSPTKGPDVSKVPRAEAPKPSEQQFRQSLAGLSRSLGERAALHPDPVAEAAARRAAVQAQIRAEDRRLKLVLGVAGAAVAAVCVAAAIVFIAAPFDPRTAAPAVTARAEPLVVTSPAPPLQAPPPPVQTAAAGPAIAPAPPQAPTPVIAEASPLPPAPLARDDIKEIQSRLQSFGFNPGPVDGNAGRMTVGAVMNYQQQRGQPQTGKLDHPLLEQLRQDPAPKVAQRAPAPPAASSSASWGQPARRNANAPAPRSADGLDFARDADAKISRWFKSLSN